MANGSVQASGAAARAAAAAAAGKVPGFGGTVDTGASGAPAPMTGTKTLFGA